jgi:hypothetical protein
MKHHRNLEQRGTPKKDQTTKDEEKRDTTWRTLRAFKSSCTLEKLWKNTCHHPQWF